MKNLSFIAFLLIAMSCSKFNAQIYNNSIYGNVRAKETDEPLVNVNIFISNTTWGTTSGVDGKFKLTSIRPGKQEIVFSMIGYETRSIAIILKDTSNVFINIRLDEKVYEFDEIKISGQQSEEWFEDLILFKEKFFGQSSIQIKCKIENEYYIEFNHPEKDILVAECKIPLFIKNYTLGYLITCEIQHFEYNSFTKTLNQKYRLYFSELDTVDSHMIQSRLLLRQKIYRRSIYYFFTTLIKDNFLESGFEIFLTANARSSSTLPGFEISSSNEILEKNESDNTYRLQFDEYVKVLQYSDYYTINESWIKLNYPFITIDKYGYPVDDYAVTLVGDWAKNGIELALPKNFILTDEEE